MPSSPQYRKEYRTAHPEIVRRWGRCSHSRKSCSLCHPARVYREYERRAKARIQKFSMSLEDFTLLLQMNCEYCGRSPKEAGGMGVDRRDNSCGYVLANCSPSCEVCNLMKRSYSREKFLDHVRLVYEFSVKDALPRQGGLPCEEE
jgi:hypothetical protein